MHDKTTGRNVAYLALGSNLGDREAHIARALRSLDAHEGIKVLSVAPMFENAPMYVEDQPHFVNTCAAVETTLRPHALLAACLATEITMGRVRTIENGPRNIDIDVVLYEDHIIDDDDLTIPHPAMLERDFVLVPLAELVPDAIHPLLLRSIAELLAELQQRERGHDGDPEEPVDDERNVPK